MSFASPTGDLLRAIATLNKIRVSLKDSGGASSNYQQEISFLKSLSTNLEALGTLQSSPLDTDASDNLQQLSEQINGPLRDFLQEIDGDFGDSLGPRSSSPSLFSRARRGPKMVKWALSTAEKVQQLKTRITVPLLALQIGMSTQIIHLALRMPSETQAVVERELNRAFHAQIRPWTEDVQRDLSMVLQRQTKLSPPGHEALDGLAESSARLSDMEMSKGKTVAVALGELASINGNVETLLRRGESRVSRGVTKPIVKYLEGVVAPMSSLGSCRHPNLSLEDRVRLKARTHAAQELSRATGLLFHSLCIFIREYLYAILPLVFICYRKLIQPLVSPRMPRPLLASLENGVIFEDALGRSSVLSFNYLQSWEMLTDIVQLWFRGLPGERNVQAGLFYIINAAKRPTSTITPTSWRSAITQGAQLQMYMMVESRSLEGVPCPMCRPQSDDPEVQAAPCTCHHPSGSTRDPSSLTSRLLSVMANPLAIHTADGRSADEDVIENSEAEISAFQRVHLIL